MAHHGVVMLLPDGVLLRPATLDDVAAGARLHRDCWREAYSPLVDGEMLAARLENEATWEDAWRAQIEAGPPRVLAARGDELIGFAVAGPNREPELPMRELYALYVRETWWGTGIGRALLDEAVDDDACSLWVLENNPRARAFYVRNGFAPDGGREHMGWLDAWEIRMRRD